MKNHKKTLLFLIVIILASIVCVKYLYKNSFINDKEVYLNKKYGFQVTYPRGWETYAIPGTSNVNIRGPFLAGETHSILLTFMDTTPDHPDSEVTKKSELVDIVVGSQSLKRDITYIPGPGDGLYAHRGINISTCRPLTSEDQLEELSIRPDKDQDYMFCDYNLKDGNKNFRIVYECPEPQCDSRVLSTMDQIVKSIKFFK